MNKNMRLISHLVLAALLAALAGPASAEWKQMKRAEGNNLGLVISVNSENPLYAGLYSVTNHTWQIPKGSGNMFGGGGLSYSPNGVVDLDGDGACEDTMVAWDRGCSCKGGVGSLEARDLVISLAGSGEIMRDAVNRIENNRVWSSLDADDMADWPAEFRQGRVGTGEPITYGAETIVGRYTDAFQIQYGVPLGASLEYSFYFLNFAESNNMMYGKCFVRNMSEFIQYNSNPNISDKVKTYAPNGFTWNEMTMTWSDYEMASPPGEDQDDGGWIYHPALEAVGIVDQDGLESSFTPQETPIFVHKVLRQMSHNGETMTFRSFCPKLYTQYGVRHGVDVLESGRTFHDAYVWQLGQEAWPADKINPWTGRQTIAGIPGVIEPTDAAYNTWLFGHAYNLYNSYAVLHDIAPRDTLSLDFVYAFVPVEPGKSYVMPKLIVENIGDPGMQQYLAPCEDYLHVAEVVHGGNYVLPETPTPPQLTIVPGDRQVTITWSDVNIDQTDAYYYFLQSHPELDPEGVYREKDFEGFRLYRNFAGPTETHAELIDTCSISLNNLHFFYVDRMVDDLEKERITNGMKVWYALVPYDRNYDPATGAEMSLPGPGSGKAWNRPGSGLYSVIPRSNASNFKEMRMGKVTFNSHSPAEIFPGTSAVLTGDGEGHLTQAPVYMEPAMTDLKLVPVLSETITQDMTLNLKVASVGWQRISCGEFAGSTAMLSVVENGQEGSPVGPLASVNNAEMSLTASGPMTADGWKYALEMTFGHLDFADGPNNMFYDINLGSYEGGSVDILPGGCGERAVGGFPALGNFIDNGRFRITWKDAGNGQLTLDVFDETHGVAVPYVEHPDDENGRGWGFWTEDNFGGTIEPGSGNGMLIDEWMEDIPRSERSAKQSQTIPADNLSNFAIFLDGLPWAALDLESMPAPGTVWVFDVAYGEWNYEGTEFTQYPDLPTLGDSWSIEVKGASLKPEDADLTKIKVVPNPYLASSYLDLSPSSRRIEFINLPDRCSISIYTLSGNLVNVLNHIGADRNGWGRYQDWDRLDAQSQPRQYTGYDNHSGTEAWNLRNRFGQTVASGLYFFHVTDSRGKSFTGKFYVVN
ncbi:hypothetical protein LLH00_02445 [bacterium]|nr:hypothetical protein [bacterium]